MTINVEIITEPAFKIAEHFSNCRMFVSKYKEQWNIFLVVIKKNGFSYHERYEVKQGKDDSEIL